MKTIYNYHPETKEYVGSSFADESPLEPGVLLIPANATKIPPPENQENKIIVFLEQENVWTYQTVEEPVIEEIEINYKMLRTAEYPSIGDQLDALFKAGVFPEEMDAQIQAVKDKYPKPE